jgi:hypothetical protein
MKINKDKLKKGMIAIPFAITFPIIFGMFQLFKIKERK